MTDNKTNLFGLLLLQIIEKENKNNLENKFCKKLDDVPNADFRSPDNFGQLNLIGRLKYIFKKFKMVDNKPVSF